MSDEAHSWLEYARENLRAAKLCLDNGLYNPSLQNAQQAAEKALKALCLARGFPLHKTHNISGLRNTLRGPGVDAGLSDEECELLDSVYLPSKYPLGSVLPDYNPD